MNSLTPLWHPCIHLVLVSPPSWGLVISPVPTRVRPVGCKLVHTSGACFGTMGARLVATSERYKTDTSLVFTVALVAPSEPGLFSAKWHMALPDGTLITCICRKGYIKQALHKPFVTMTTMCSLAVD